MHSRRPPAPILLLCGALLAGCPVSKSPSTGPGDSSPTGTEETGDGGGGGETDDTGDTATGPCPRRMVLVGDALCIDMAEAALEEWDGSAWVAASPYLTVSGRQVRAVVALGEIPQGYISGDEAEAACAASGKRLCTSEEWLQACQGPKGTTWPYGNTYASGACNDAYAGGHPVIDYFGTADGVWDTEHMNDPGINQQAGTVTPGGSLEGCVSAWGAFDLHGNLHEWVADAEGTFRGGFYADGAINGQGCTYLTTAHDRSYHDYSTGFRCCASPVE